MSRLSISDSSAPPSSPSPSPSSSSPQYNCVVFNGDPMFIIGFVLASNGKKERKIELIARCNRHQWVTCHHSLSLFFCCVPFNLYLTRSTATNSIDVNAEDCLSKSPSCSMSSKICLSQCSTVHI